MTTLLTEMCKEQKAFYSIQAVQVSPNMTTLRILMGIILILMHTNLMYVMTLIVIVNHNHHIHMNPLLNIALHHTHKPHTTIHLHMILTHIHHTNNHMNHT